MKILFDIGHPAQLNFYLNAITFLSKNNNIIVTVLDRGRLLKIANKELGKINNCKIVSIGKYNGTKFSVIKDVVFIRLLSLLKFCFNNKPDILIGNGFLHGIVGKILNIPSIMFGDDIERKIDVRLKTIFSTKIHYAFGNKFKKINKKIISFNALKEWAYLSPKYFIPNKEELKKYDIKPKEYIFIREVSTSSLNYSNQKSNLIASISKKIPSDIKVLLSLEDKSTLDLYPKNWILLKEPIEDIHSLMYYSKIIISSGDSMAREGAILGVPSVYCGIRKMSANKVMMAKGMLFHKNIEKVPFFFKIIINNYNKLEEQNKFRQKLEEEWIDTTEFIINTITKYQKK